MHSTKHPDPLYARLCLFACLFVALLVCLLAPLKTAFAIESKLEISLTPFSFEQANTPEVEKKMATMANQLLSLGGINGIPWDANQLFRLQLLAGDFTNARTTIGDWRKLRAKQGQTSTETLFVVYEIYALTHELQQQELQRNKPLSFAEASQIALRQYLAQLDDLNAFEATYAFGTALNRLESEFQKNLASQQDKTTIPISEALNFSRQYLAWKAYSGVLPITSAVVAEDDRRRYHVEESFLISGESGVQIDSLMIRPRLKDAGSNRLTTLLSFTIYVEPEWSYTYAKQMAAHGYAGIVSYPRGKGRSTNHITPYEHDGEDARTVIDWISKQAWSDGQVGMYGGSYSAFTQWAAAKKMPKALKALATSASAAPGIDVPMQGNIFLNFLYPWIPYVTNNATLDNATYNDHARWEKLDKTWYQQGSAYRELDAIDGTPNPLHRRWLQHPSYDHYWQAMIPYQKEFAKITIPVLTTTGYFDGAQVGALYYFGQHTHYLPKADHTLLLGPYNHTAMQGGVPNIESGYTIDQAAKIDLAALRLQWFDHVFKGNAKPALLKDRVNYQVMGTNTWKHASSLASMSNTRLSYFLRAPTASQAEYILSEERNHRQEPIELSVDMRQRDDVNDVINSDRIIPKINQAGQLIFASEALKQATEISGLFSGQLRFILNKKDVDLVVTLYEQMPNGEYFELASHLGRASYARDRSHRRLLEPGKPHTLDFTAERITSRLLSVGSRIVIAIGVPKTREQQLNYGSGKDVSTETLADAGEAIKILWLNNSVIHLPVWR